MPGFFPVVIFLRQIFRHQKKTPGSFLPKREEEKRGRLRLIPYSAFFSVDATHVGDMAGKASFP